MNIRWAAAVAGLIALSCAIYLLYLMVLIDDTRQSLHTEGVHEFTSIQQIDRNLDNLIASLVAYRLATDTEQVDALRQSYITRFDIFYSALSVDSGWMAYLEGNQSAQQLIEASQHFLSRYEPLMNKNIVPEESLLVRMGEEARDLSQKAYKTAIALSATKTKARDSLLKRMARLLKILWITGLVFLLMTTIAIGFLCLSFKKAPTA